MCKSAYEQVFHLIGIFDAQRVGKDLLDASISSSAYAEVIASAALLLESGSLTPDVADPALDALRKRVDPLDKQRLGYLDAALLQFSGGAVIASALVPKLNRATFRSWLMFLSRAVMCGLAPSPSSEFSLFLNHFEKLRSRAAGESKFPQHVLGDVAPEWLLFSIYDAHSSAVDTSAIAVVLRDAVIWVAYEDFLRTRHAKMRVHDEMLAMLHAGFSVCKAVIDGDAAAARLIELGWAKLR